MSYRALALLLLCLAGMPLPAWAFECRPVLQGVLLLEDAGGKLTAAEVDQLPDERFRVLEPGPFPYRFSHSAFWLRLTLHNPGKVSCHGWLQIGEPRLEQVQVFWRDAGRWNEMRVGSNFPLQEWSVEQLRPSFPLLMGAGETREVLARIYSRSLLAVAPSLLSDEQGLLSRENASLVDGVVLGIMLLIVPFGLIVGLQIRSTLLLTNVLLSLAYLVLTCVLNGYLLYWPTQLPWTREWVGILSGSAALLFMFYIGVLFQVHLLSWFWRMLLLTYALLVIVLLLGGTLFDLVDSRSLFSTLRWGFYLLVPLLCLGSWMSGRRLNRLSWLLAGAMVIQALIPLFFEGKPLLWSYGKERVDLASGLLGTVLLFSTLISEFTRSRRDAQRANNELETLRVAEQQRLESTVALRTEQLRNSLKARSALLARISHDLRSPLSSIIDCAQLLKTKGLEDYPQRIERSARLQLELIDELLQMSRDELIQEELVQTPGYLYGFLREIEEEACFFAERQGNRLDCQFANDLPPLVLADFRQLRRVLINLLGNASKFTRDGLIILRVENCTDEGRGLALHFSVIDTGVGVSSEVRERLLKPFQRGGNTAGVEGFGLGLSIVSDLLRQMGSELIFEDNPEGGACFRFVLQVEASSEDAVDLVLREGSAPVRDGAGRRILLVDDHEPTLEYLGDLLSGHGYDMISVAYAEEALASIAWEHLDLVIVDQHMPGMDGWTLLREVRHYRPDLPVLLYSSSPSWGENDGMHFDAELLKPASAEQLLGCIERLLSVQAEPAG